MKYGKLSLVILLIAGSTLQAKNYIFKSFSPEKIYTIKVGDTISASLSGGTDVQGELDGVTALDASSYDGGVFKKKSATDGNSMNMEGAGTELTFKATRSGQSVLIGEKIGQGYYAINFKVIK